MSLRTTRCLDAVAMARRVLALAGVRGPEDIDVPLIAFDWGVCSIPKRLPGHDGNLVRRAGGGYVLAAIDEAAFGTPRGDFTLAHELGHHLLDDEKIGARACFEGERGSAYYRSERRADVFAVELKLPAQFVGPRVCDEAPTMELVEDVAYDFRASFTSTALRLVDFWKAPAAVVLSRRGIVVRHVESEAFPLRLVEGFAIGPGAFARDREVLRWHESARKPERVAAEDWSRTPRRGVALHERSVGVGDGRVLTLLTT